MRGTHLLREGTRQERGLVVAALDHPHPVQRDRRDQRPSGQEGRRRSRHPFRRRAHDLLPVTMFERQNQGAPIVTIEHHRPTTPPRTGDAHAFVAMRAIRHSLSGERHAASIATHSRDEVRIAPARTAQREVAVDLGAADGAAWRIDQVQGCLKRRQVHTSIPVMKQDLTDRRALMRNRRRASVAPAPFLHEHVADEIKDRLELVNKSFRSPAVISGLPQVWQSLFPDARCIPDNDTLDLTEGAHDLIVHVLSLHWANDPVGQMIQARRALQPDGLFLGVLFGGSTLHELRSAFAQAESDLLGGLSPRVAPMGEIRDLGALLQRAGFALPVADNLALTVTYSTPLRLMHDLRAMGEGNALAARERRGLRRAVLHRMCDLYAMAFGTPDGRIPATFDLIFLTGWCPGPNQPRPLRPGSASARLADALSTKETPLID